MDLAAGTSRLTRLLARSQASLIAVEPVERIRRIFGAALPKQTIVGGTAESLPLRDSSLDVIAVAQAFHRLNGEVASKENSPHPAPRGGLYLVWNVRDDSPGWVKEVNELMRSYDESCIVPRYNHERWRKALKHSGLFGELNEVQFRDIQRVDRETMVKRFSSISFIASLSQHKRQEFEVNVRAILADNSETAASHLIELAYRAEVFWCHKN